MNQKSAKSTGIWTREGIIVPPIFFSNLEGRYTGLCLKKICEFYPYCATSSISRKQNFLGHVPVRPTCYFGITLEYRYPAHYHPSSNDCNPRPGTRVCTTLTLTLTLILIPNPTNPNLNPNLNPNPNPKTVECVGYS